MKLFFGLATAIAQAHFNLVVPLSIEQTKPIEMGDIYNIANIHCELTAQGSQGEGCASSNTSLGKLMLRGNEAEQVLITVTPVTNNSVSFTPIFDNGKQTLSVSLSSIATEISIGGAITVAESADLGPQSISYLIEVNYQ